MEHTLDCNQFKAPVAPTHPDSFCSLGHTREVVRIPPTRTCQLLVNESHLSFKVLMGPIEIRGSFRGAYAVLQARRLLERLASAALRCGVGRHLFSALSREKAPLALEARFQALLQTNSNLNGSDLNFAKGNCSNKVWEQKQPKRRGECRFKPLVPCY